VKIERELSEATGVKVDLLTEKAISPYLIERIKSDAVVIIRIKNRGELGQGRGFLA